MQAREMSREQQIANSVVTGFVLRGPQSILGAIVDNVKFMVCPICEAAKDVQNLIDGTTVSRATALVERLSTDENALAEFGGMIGFNVVFARGVGLGAAFSTEVGTAPAAQAGAKGAANVTQPVVKGFSNIGGGATTAEQTLSQAQKWLGQGYKEIAPGVYRSADNTRQFRMTVSDLTDLKQGPHVHFEAIGPDGRTIIENSHVGITNP